MWFILMVIRKLVSIADTPGEFVAAIEQYLSTERSKSWLKEVDDFFEICRGMIYGNE